MRKLIEYAVLLFLIAYTFVRGVIPGWTTVHSDFANYYVSAKLVTSNEPLDKLYDNAWFQKKINEQGISTQGKFAPFPLATAWIMTPFVAFSPLHAQRIFLCLNLLLIIAGISLLQRLIGWPLHQCALLLFAAGAGLYNNLAFGQLYLAMTVFTLYAILLARNQHFAFLAGLILAAFSSIKYFPVVIIAGYFLHVIADKSTTSKQPWLTPDVDVVKSAILVSLVIVCAEILIFGMPLFSEYIHSVLLPHLDGHLHGQGLYTYLYQTWDNLFRNLFVYEQTYNPHPLLNWPEGKTICKMIITMGVVITGCLLMYKHRHLEKESRQYLYLAIPSLMAMVLLPVGATYHFIVLLIPIVLLISGHLLKGTKMIAVIVIYALIGFIPYGIAFDLASSWGIAFAYPRLWLVSALYILVLNDLFQMKNLRLP